MKLSYTPATLAALEEAPASIRKLFWKQMRFLESNLLHPGLRAKQYSESTDIWQGRVTRGWRFYFKITGDTIMILDMIPHPK